MLQCLVHGALPGCPGCLPPLSFLRCYLSGKWVRSSEGGALSLEQRLRFPPCAFGTQWRRGSLVTSLPGWLKQTAPGPYPPTALSRAGTRQVTKPEC